MKIFTSALVTETNTFSAFPTTLGSFEELGIVRGPVTDDALNDVGPIVKQWRRLAGEYGDTVHEGIYAIAQPAGTVDAAAYRQLRGEILAALEQAMPVNMVLLFLHGAMVAEGVDDCEGELIAAVRALAGPDCVIGVELDPHCHMSHAMTRQADALILMREYPHIDYEERAIELFELCRAAAAGKTRPVMEVADCAMVGFYPTTAQPMRGLVDLLAEVERRPGILSASYVHGFPWADVPDAGTKVVVVADQDRALAARTAHELAQALYRVRRELLPRLESAAQVLDPAPAGPFPVILADAGDNPGGGAPCDHTGLLAELLRRPALRCAFGMLWDPAAVDACHLAGIGAVIQLAIGGKTSPASGTPLQLQLTVCGLAEQHSQQFGTMSDPLGRAAWVRCGAVDIVLVSRRQQVLSPTAFTGLGVPLHEATVIAVKSSHHYYAEFSRLSTNCHVIETGAALSMDFAHLPYRKRGKAYYPAVADPAPELA
ncbi:M81 family metallopeptidase [Pseudoduganella violacea]|uniref:Microcystinase C n=1 Tax=Pseudoduganella violacea TaxID=1715466 RepID=A0A7W5FVQ3_9BURK|nr:M81 family metallopeptidase [Pseudoduganella violacea]MBB3120996.1 microcystin degradation protein MlrC [Pseudoduganella violacea]